jgi:hypothetical protein
MAIISHASLYSQRSAHIVTFNQGEQLPSTCTLYIIIYYYITLTNSKPMSEQDLQLVNDSLQLVTEESL